MRKAVIIRGLPGSGKTTLAKELCKQFNISYCEADHYFYDLQGNYNWNPRELKQAHAQCQDTFSEMLNLGCVPIVSNTFTTKKEMQWYVDQADIFLVITCEGEFKSVHSVPEETLDKMSDRWEYQPFGPELYYDPTDFDDREKIVEKVASFLDFKYSKNFLSINTY